MGLPHQAGFGDGVVREVGVQHLDGDRPAPRAVLGEEHLAHAPFADARLQMVVAEDQTAPAALAQLLGLERREQVVRDHPREQAVRREAVGTIPLRAGDEFLYGAIFDQPALANEIDRVGEGRGSRHGR